MLRRKQSQTDNNAVNQGRLSPFRRNNIFSPYISPGRCVGNISPLRRANNPGNHTPTRSRNKGINITQENPQQPMALQGIPQGLSPMRRMKTQTRHMQQLNQITTNQPPANNFQKPKQRFQNITYLTEEMIERRLFEERESKDNLKLFSKLVSQLSSEGKKSRQEPSYMVSGFEENQNENQLKIQSKQVNDKNKALTGVSFSSLLKGIKTIESVEGEQILAMNKKESLRESRKPQEKSNQQQLFNASFSKPICPEPQQSIPKLQESLDMSIQILLQKIQENPADPNSNTLKEELVKMSINKGIFDINADF